MNFSQNEMQAAERELAKNPELPGAVLAEVRHFAAKARDENNWQRLDAEMRAEMAAITRLAGAEQLIALRRLRQKFAAEAEAKAASDKEASQARFQARHAQDLDRQREATRATWAARATKGALAALQSLQDKLLILDRAFGAAGDDKAVLAVLAAFEAALTSAAASLAIERQAVLARLSPAPDGPDRPEEPAAEHPRRPRPTTQPDIAA